MNAKTALLTEYALWRAARNQALRTLDIAHFKASCPPGCSDEVALIGLHKVRYDRADIEPALRLESGEWLRARGYGRQNGTDLLPPAQLPE